VERYAQELGMLVPFYAFVAMVILITEELGMLVPFMPLWQW
jgi:hypothetical protein